MEPTADPSPAADASPGAMVAPPPAPTAITLGSGGPPRELRDAPRRRATDRPITRLLIVFTVILLAGTLVLALPVSRTGGAWTDALTAFFTATSALTGAGFVVVDTGTYWSWFGQLVILALFWIGGVGVMASTSLVLIAFGRRADLRSRLMLSGTSGVPLAEGRAVVVRTVLYVAIATAAGGVVLAILFFARGGLGPMEAAWWGLFHAASAFTNAGFDITGGMQSLVPFAGDLPLVLVVIVLMFAGSLGLVAVTEAWQVRRWEALSVETRLVLLLSVGLALAGALSIALSEWTNPATLGPMGTAEKAANALFFSVTARSTGLTTLDVSAMRPESLSVTTGLMFVGGTVGSPTGGVRVNTIAVLLVVVLSVLRRRREPAALGRRLEARTVYLALTVVALAIAAVSLGSLLTQLVLGPEADAARGQIDFEVVSVLGTVGLSTGLTAGLEPAGQLLMIAFMLFGRLSILALAVLFARGISTRGGRPPRAIMRVA